MKRKRFVKLVMSQRIPRDTAVAVADIVRMADVPYGKVLVIGKRPYYDSYEVVMMVDSWLLQRDPDPILEMGTSLKRELNKISKKNKAKCLKQAARFWFSRKPLGASGYGYFRCIPESESIKALDVVDMGRAASDGFARGFAGTVRDLNVPGTHAYNLKIAFQKLKDAIDRALGHKGANT